MSGILSYKLDRIFSRWQQQTFVLTNKSLKCYERSSMAQHNPSLLWKVSFPLIFPSLWWLIPDDGRSNSPTLRTWTWPPREATSLSGWQYTRRTTVCYCGVPRTPGSGSTWSWWAVTAAWSFKWQANNLRLAVTSQWRGLSADITEPGTARFRSLRHARRRYRAGC